MRNLGFFLLLALGHWGHSQTITVTEHEVPAKPDQLELDGIDRLG